LEGDRDYIIFSSLLAALVSGAAKEGAGEGRIEGHIWVAVSTNRFLRQKKLTVYIQCPTETLKTLLASP
jgi:hypothetical protein